MNKLSKSNSILTFLLQSVNGLANIALISAVVMSIFTSTAFASSPNLLANPGAEFGGGGWNGIEIVSKENSQNTERFPLILPHEGKSFFKANVGGGLELSQKIDVSRYASSIDRGNTKVEFGMFMITEGTAKHLCSLKIEYYESYYEPSFSANQPLSPTGLETIACPNNVPEWSKINTSGTIPVGTRDIVLTIGLTESSTECIGQHWAIGNSTDVCDVAIDSDYFYIDAEPGEFEFEPFDPVPNFPVENQPYIVKFETNSPATISWIPEEYTISEKQEKEVVAGQLVSFTYTYPKEGTFTWVAKATDKYDNTQKEISQRIRVVSRKIGDKIEKEQNIHAQPKTCKADPIDLATGAQLLNHDLLTVQGVLPLSFSINYHSLLTNESILGRAWGPARFDASLQELSDGNVEVHWSTNQSNVFTKNADGTYKPSHVACRFDTLVKNADDSFTLTRKNQILYEFDAAGQLIALGNRQRQSLTFTRDESGRMTQVTEPVSGVFLRYTYNTEGLLETVSDPLERQVRFGYDSERNLTQITDAAGQTTTYTYNELGQTLTGTNADGVQFFSNTYDDELRIVAQDDAVATNQEARLSFDDSQPERIITTFTNRNGQTQVYTYDDNYYLLSLQDELGNITNYTYDANGKRISTTNANGKTTQFAYNNNGNLTTSTDAKGNATQMVYDDNSNLLSVTDTLGKTITFTYDENNNRISATNALGNTTRYTYNSHGQVLTATSPSNAVTTYEYEKGLPVRVIDPEGNTQTSRYDAAGRLISTTNSEGHTTTFAYDGVNRLVSVTDVLNRTVSMTYDSRDNLLTSTDAKGNVTRRNYDGNDNLISQINALAQETRYEYDGESRLIKVIDAKSHVTQLGYDAKGRLISTTDALDNTQQLSYDAADNLLAEIDALGKTVAIYSYDVLNNPISVTNALGHQTQSEYDALSRLTRVTDPLNWATQFNYDDSDRLVASVDAKGGQSSQAFDIDGNLTGLTDANSHQTTFQFDNNGRLVEETSASGGSVRYTYNARDLQTAVTNARGQQRQFEYDAVGRITRLTDPDGTVSYTYDQNDNVLTVTDASGTISREYDALDRVVKYTDSQGNALQYAYDAVSHLVTLTYPDGKQVSYEYDANDQLTQVTDWAGRETRYVYDANGRLVEVVRSNGTQMTYTYNVAGQLVQQKDVASNGEVIRQFDFVYDAAGDIVKEQVVPEPTFFPFIPATMTYTAANRLATYNGEAVTFDADGNMTLGPLNGDLVTFAFDSRNRLSNVGDMAYRYDTENQRIAVSVAGQETRYVINPQAVLSQTLVRTAPDGTQTFYVYGLGLIGEEMGGVYQAYHFDLRGSTVALSDAAGNVVEQFQYSPFGGLVSHNPADVDTPFLYNGRDGVMTDDTGLYYMRARFYNQEIRRFVNRDVLLGSVDDGQSLNRFAYVTGEPVQYIDPFGLSDMLTLGSTIGISLNRVGRQLLTKPNPYAMAAGAICLGAAAVVSSDISTTRTRQCPNNVVYRSMTITRMTSGQAIPVVGPTARTLGVRPNTDIQVNDNRVEPKGKGMSVAVGNPYNLVKHRRPPTWDGTGKEIDPVWGIRKDVLGPKLKLTQDSPKHAVIEPKYPMSLDDYQTALAETRDRWHLYLNPKNCE